jgi:hypothetical protein
MFVVSSSGTDMRYIVATALQLFGIYAYAQPSEPIVDGAGRGLVREPFFPEYALGVQQLPVDGGRIFGWQVNDRVTFGRFKGECDEFGFSVRLNAREHVEITTEGIRWRHALGGAR